MTYFVYLCDGGHIVSEYRTPEEAQCLIDANGSGVMAQVAAPSDTATVKYLKYLDGNFIFETQADIDAENMIDFRIERNKRLAETDWSQANDSPLSASLKNNYQTYRQNLRDMPQTDGFDPLNPEWPTLP